MDIIIGSGALLFKKKIFLADSLLGPLHFTIYLFLTKLLSRKHPLLRSSKSLYDRKTAGNGTS